MQIAVVLDGTSAIFKDQPWIRFRSELADYGFQLQLFEGETLLRAFERPFDAMILTVWLDWKNPRLFDARRTMRLLEHYSTYRAEYPQTVQIVVNHTDMARRPYATIYWRPGDPILYRTPAYDRSELRPFPPDSIWPYELVWGSARFVSDAPVIHKAGFAGRTSGPAGYRERVAEQTARVGLGLCGPELPLAPAEYERAMAACQILVCPRGWGEQSQRHWDAWLSGKPVLTDRDCDSVEMIPGVRLHAGEHYLVYDDPAQIPDIVEEWTAPGRREQLAQIAACGRAAACSYDPLANLVAFLRQAVPG